VTNGGVSFTEVVARSEHVSPRAIEIGTAFADAIPPPTETQGLRDAALWWATWVGKIVPLWPGVHERAKEARGDLLGHGWTVDEAASRDVAQVREWWTDAPFSNIGFATRSNGILVVDLDPRHGGLERWRALCVRYGIDDSDVPRSVSPRGDGGQHLWFRVPADWEGVDGHSDIAYPHSPLLPGVDRPWQVPVQPSMRIVVVDAASRDPSRREGLRAYRWVAGDPRALPIAPPVLLGEQLETSSDGSSGGFNGGSTNGNSSVSSGTPGVPIDARVGHLSDGPLDIQALATSGVPVGEQSYTFKRMACSMVARGWDDETIVSVLLLTAQQSPVGDPDDPWTIAHLVPMVAHARRYIERSRAAETARNRQFAKNLARRWR
jgi:hypothetical protein